MKTIIVIPARHWSTRFPGKPLAKLANKPMIVWVAERSAKAVGTNNVYIATDDTRIETVVKQAGFQCVMTSRDALTGTDRLAEVAQTTEADIYINVQGDEPLVHPQDILKIIEAKKANPNEVINGYCSLSQGENPHNLNIPKVIFTENKRLMYISRQPLPGFKNQKNAPAKYYKQVCIYAFNRQELFEYAAFGRKSVVERSEDIEIIRFLELGKKIRMVETRHGSFAVDIPEDVVNMENVLHGTCMTNDETGTL